MIEITHQLKDLVKYDQPIHLALGVFDGVHVGHREVIQTAVDAAKLSKGIAGVLTFDPHPIQVIAPERAPMRILASIAHKSLLLDDLGCRFLMVQTFDKTFAAQRARDFIASIKAQCPQVKTISVGEDWQFGRGREGNVATLREWGREMGFEVFAAAPVMNKGERVSSTRIRQAIRDGSLAAIEEMLGRKYSVMGDVLKGRQLARQLGFPTANIKVQNEQLPPDGVWAVEVLVNDSWLKGIGNLGKRPTVENDSTAQRLLEVHLFDYEGDLYGAELNVKFLKYVRPEMKFGSVEELRQQIVRDVSQVRETGFLS